MSKNKHTPAQEDRLSQIAATVKGELTAQDLPEGAIRVTAVDWRTRDTTQVITFGPDA